MATLSASEVHALVAIENVTTRRLVVGLFRESGFNVLEEAKDADYALLYLRRGGTVKLNIIICDRLGNAGHEAILKFVRWNEGGLNPALPVIGIDSHWTADELIAVRDSGISATLTLPLTKRSLQMAISAAMAKEKAFISSPVFRGPDRRFAVIKGYKGPFRRADDALTRRHPGSPVIAQSVDHQQVKRLVHPQEVVTPSSSVDAKAEIEWSAAIATGRDDIDDQHRKIIDFLKILGTTSTVEYEKKAVDDVFNGLSDYLKMHLKYEESLMDSFDYDEIDKHKRIHAAFVEKVDGINRDELHDSGGSEKLFFLIYNWLVTHIVSMDSIMIAKMNGEYDDEVGSQNIHKQTGIVIENAYELAARIMNVNMQTNAIADGRRKKSVVNEISKSTERLINLMELADSRVQVNGCSNFQLRRLGEIRSALTKSADSLAEIAAKKVIKFCSDILSGKQGVPLGLGDVLRRQLGRVSSLAGVIGGFDAMSSTSKSAAIMASELAGKVLEIELGSAASLRDFGDVET